MSFLRFSLFILLVLTLSGCFLGEISNNEKNDLPLYADGVVWYSGFETGDLSEWSSVGGFIRQSGSDYYSIISPHAHTGKYSLALRINTSIMSETGAHAAYMFFWEKLPADEYYYSAWFYLPSDIKPGDWWIIWQWKSTYNGNSDDSKPIYVVGISEFQEQFYVNLVYLPDQRDKITYIQYDKIVPKDQWFQLEAYYKKSETETGQVVVWQDGVELFNVTGFPTVLSDKTLYWSVNHYAEFIEPNPCTIYIDDVAISSKRLDVSYDYTILK